MSECSNTSADGVEIIEIKKQLEEYERLDAENSSYKRKSQTIFACSILT